MTTRPSISRSRPRILPWELSHVPSQALLENRPRIPGEDVARPTCNSANLKPGLCGPFTAFSEAWIPQNVAGVYTI